MRRRAAASISTADADRLPLSVPATSALVAALAALVYSGTLAHGFVWDDPISVQRWLPAIPNLADAFFPPRNIPQFPVDYYRPLQLLSYRIDRRIGGGAPWPFHLTVVLLHMLATVLVFRSGLGFLGRASTASWAALWAAALFAVHPIHSESVAWMAARPDVMVTGAGLAALLAYRRSEWSELGRASVAAGFLFAGLLCKETAAALLVMVPLSSFILTPAAPRGAAKRGRGIPSRAPSLAGLLPFVIALVAYLMLRAAGSYAALPDAEMPSNLGAAVVGAVGTYFRLLVFPYPQNAYIADVPAGLTLAVGALCAGAFVAVLGRAWKRDDRALSFALLWIALTLAPSLGVIAKTETAPLAERYLYLPSVGFCWAFGMLVSRLCERGGGARLAAQIVAAGLVAGAAVVTVQRNRIWTDNYSLWTETAAKNDVDGLPLRSLAAATLERGDSQAAERLFLAALDLRNTTRGKFIIYNNLGTIALGRNDDVTAEQYYRKAAEFEPGPALLYNLGLMRLRRGLEPALAADATVRADALTAARDLFERAIEASPHDADIHVGLAQTAEALGDRPTARRHFERAMALGLSAPTESAVRQRLEALR